MDTYSLRRLLILSVVCLQLSHQVSSEDKKEVYISSENGNYGKNVNREVDEMTDVSFCDFESNDMCGYLQASDDDFDWTKRSGSTPSSSTGPSHDHTLMTNTGSYMYTEVSGRYGRFMLRKQIASDNSDAKYHCTFTFWYHMYGSDIGTLNIIVSDMVKWTMQGNQGDRWFEGSLTFSAFSSDWIIIEGISGQSYRGDIAIDDLELKCHVQSRDHYFTSLEGTLTSPNYPSTYPNNAVYTYVIDLRHEGISAIGFHFNDFELEQGYDRLYYGEGATVMSGTLGYYTGYSTPSDQVVSGDQMWFYFGSDGSVTYRGFSISWMGFGGESTTPEDLLTTDEVTTPDPTTIESTTLDQTTTEEYDPNLPTVDCTGESLTVFIPRSLIGSVDASHLHFINESCVGADHNSSHVELSTSFDACGTMMEVGDDYIILSNVVQDEALPKPGELISRDDNIEINAECRMEKDGLSSISFLSDVSKIRYSDYDYGKFSFNLQLYEDGSYVLPYPPEAYPIEVHVRDMLYFEAQVSARQGLELFVKDCVATPTEDPLSTPQYTILQDGCPSDDTFQFFTSGDPMIRHFGFEAFFFVDSQAPVYVHCYLMLCNEGDPNSRCAQGCISKSARRKRSLDHTGSKSYVMTRGPIHFQE